MQFYRTSKLNHGNGAVFQQLLFSVEHLNCALQEEFCVLVEGYVKIFIIYSMASYNLSVVLYGRETWLLILREKHSVTVSHKRVLRKLFGTTVKNVFSKGS